MARNRARGGLPPPHHFCERDRAACTRNQTVTKVRTLMVGVATMAAWMPTAAMAAPATLDAQVIGNVSVDEDDPTKAYVTARYRCEGETGLWVSVKQGEGGRVDQRLREEGSSQFADAMSHSHRHQITCDGTWQRGTFTVDQLEWGFGELVSGQAWVQFCLTQGTDHDGIVVSSNRWSAVR